MLTQKGAIMALITIDLMGDSDDTIVIPKEETEEEKARIAEMQRKALWEIFKRAPRPQLVPVEQTPPQK